MAGIALKPKQFERLLRDNGYTYNRQTGDHKIFTKEGCGHICYNMSKLNPIIVQRLIKEHQLVRR